MNTREARALPIFKGKTQIMTKEPSYNLKVVKPLTQIYKMASDAIRLLEATRDYDSANWTEDMANNYRIYNKIWDLCRESKDFKEHDFEQN